MKKDNSQFTAIFIKPDAINDGLEEMIIRDFVDAGFIFMFAKPIEMTEDQATFVYKDHIGNPNFPFAVGSILGEGECKTSLFLVAKQSDGDALVRAQEAKGRADGSGIRAKYRRYHWTDLRERGIEGDEKKTMLSRNRIHIPDTDEHVCQIIEMVLDKSELTELKALDSEFRTFLEGPRAPGSPEIEVGGNGKERI